MKKWILWLLIAFIFQRLYILILHTSFKAKNRYICFMTYSQELQHIYKWSHWCSSTLMEDPYPIQLHLVIEAWRGGYTKSGCLDIFWFQFKWHKSLAQIIILQSNTKWSDKCTLFKIVSDYKLLLEEIIIIYIYIYIYMYIWTRKGNIFDTNML